MLNFYVAWISMLLGAVAGAVTGLFFNQENFLGGYATWQRRMVRLGHIAFFGIGFINLMFAFSVRYLEIPQTPRISSILLVIAAVTMPLTCYLSAVKPFFRHLFFIPAVSVIGALVFFVWRIIYL